MADDPQDHAPAIREECRKNSCKPLIAAYDACVARVNAKGDGNCAGQFGDLLKCIDKCSAQKIFAGLK